MQVIMNQYVSFIAVWCLAINTYIVFSSGHVKVLENREKKRMEKIIYFITAAMMLGYLAIYMFAGIDAEWVYWSLKITNYFLYLLKYLYLTVFTLYIMDKGGRFAKVKKILLAVSVLSGIAGMVCISLPEIREEFYYFSSLYGIIRALLILDILVLLIALLLEKKRVYATLIVVHFLSNFYLKNGPLF